VTVTLSSGSPEIDDLTVASTDTLTITGGNLSVTGKGTVGGKLNLSSGSLGGPSTGVVTVSGTMTWTNGTITGVVDIPAKATLAIQTPQVTYSNPTFVLAGGVINNSGTVTQTFAGAVNGYANAGFAISGGGVINNLAGGVWNVASDVWVYPTDSSATAFNNIGTFNKAGGTETSVWALPVSGKGSINIEVGTINFIGSSPTSNLSGTVTIASGSALGYGQGGIFSAGAVVGTGTLTFPARPSLPEHSASKELFRFRAEQWTSPPPPRLPPLT
jgi:hypothetical protein